MEEPIIFALEDEITPDVYTVQSDITTLGRADMCQIVVSRQTISRIHATITRNGPRYLLQDANSANGTYVNHLRIQKPHLLKDQDLIGLGTPNPVLRFEDPDPTVRLSGRLQYNESTMAFTLNRKPLNLPPAQFKLLLHLYHHAGQVCTRESCAYAIWQREYDSDIDADALDRAISNLRRELRKAAPDSKMLQTRRGLGYILVL